MSLMSFFSEFDELTARNPLNNRASVWDNAVALEVKPFDGCVRLSNIRSLQPGRGDGTRALLWLMALADKHDVFITGAAKPTGAKRLTKTALKSWYRRHDFAVSSKGEIRYTPAGRK